MSLELDVAAKTTLILLGVTGLAWTLRPASASVRHTVWTLGLLAALAVPMALTILPSQVSIDLPLLPQAEPHPLVLPIAPQVVSEKERAVSPESPAGPSTRPPTANAQRSSITEPAANNAASVETPASSMAANERVPQRTPTLKGTLRLLWGFGASVVLAGWVAALWQLRRMRLRSKPLAEADWQQPLDRVRRELAVAKPIQLRIAADEAPPMTWGILRPVIQLPASAVDWPEARRRMVLAHELAHVKRNDGVGQILCQASYSVYWFNPMVWYAVRSLQAERERACDDQVLGLGVPAADYAEHLLHIARGLNSGFVRTAVSMAHPSQLKARMLAILDSRARRQRTPMLAGAALLSVIGAATLGIAAIQVTAFSALALPRLETIPAPAWVAELFEAPAPQDPQAAPAEPSPASVEVARAFIDQYCVQCHKPRMSALDLEGKDVAQVRNDARTWEKVARCLRSGLLSHGPMGESRPQPAELRRIAAWLENELDRDAPPFLPPPGAHRLNRTEYGNAVRALLGLDIDATVLLPQDDMSDYFDNQARALNTSPLLEQAYISAAAAISARAWNPFSLVRSDSCNGCHGAVPSRQQLPSTNDKTIFACHPNAKDDEECARRILTDLARRAFRRPLSDEDVSSLMALYRTGRNINNVTSSRLQQEAASGGPLNHLLLAASGGLEAALRSILTDRDFLYRIEAEPASLQSGQSYRISDRDLASRLSFFLWSSIPDDRLIDLASRGELHDPIVLERETRRMLTDPRAQAMPVNFVAQWLGFRRMREVSPKPQVFPDFDEPLRQAMQREADLFVAAIAREDRSVLDFLDANYTFLNERLAKHYGIPGISGTEFRRVPLGAAFDARRGVLGKGAFLATTYEPYAMMSIVLRGTWVLRLLGVEAMPPPPNVAPLGGREAGDPNPLTDRQRLENTYINRTCVGCHRPIDPLGYALDNFDGIGAWRTEDAGKPIDAADVLVDGTKVNGVADLRNVLLSHSDQFVRAFTEKLMTYALGRRVEYRDMPMVRSIARDAARDNNRFSSIVLGIVKSPAFQMNAKP